jgi:hypothetical protein
MTDPQASDRPLVANPRLPANLAYYEVWCVKHGFATMPATPEVVGAYLAAAGEGYAMPTLRRRVAGIALGHRLRTTSRAVIECGP